MRGIPCSDIDCNDRPVNRVAVLLTALHDHTFVAQFGQAGQYTCDVVRISRGALPRPAKPVCVQCANRLSYAGHQERGRGIRTTSRNFIRAILVRKSDASALVLAYSMVSAMMHEPHVALSSPGPMPISNKLNTLLNVVFTESSADVSSYIP
jgi:hypothetical protein